MISHRYFRQLQEISDTVAEVEWTGTLADAITANGNALSSFETKINTARARQRYMDNLSKLHEEGTLDEDDRSCILCKCDFIRGYITQWYVAMYSRGRQFLILPSAVRMSTVRYE